jgi:hypothetical protein
MNRWKRHGRLRMGATPLDSMQSFHDSQQGVSGISFRIAANAEKPSSADRRLYPISVSRYDRVVRIEQSSSRMRILDLVSDITHLAT